MRPTPPSDFDYYYLLDCRDYITKPSGDTVEYEYLTFVRTALQYSGLRSERDLNSVGNERADAGRDG